MRPISALLTGLAFAGSAFASPATEAFVSDIADRVETLEGPDIATEIVDLLDMKRIARFTLGRHARTFSDDDIQRFETGFEAFLLETMTQYADRFESAEIAVIGSFDRNERDSIVETRVTFPGEDPYTVRWRLLERRGEWRVVDMQMFDLWLAIEQRAQLGSILSRRGATIDEALDALEVETEQPKLEVASAEDESTSRER
ncbi:MAG: ABC transporter substrate-binding protein [Pseudomonadota bacterium]